LRALATAAALLLTAAAAFGLTVELRESAAVQGPRVTLSDVAKMRHAGESAEALGRAELAFIPEGESETTVGPDSVRRALRAAGLSPAHILVKGASKCRVTREAAGTTEAGRLAGALESFLEARTGERGFSVSDIRLDFDVENVARPVVVAARPKALSGRIRFDVAQAGSPGRVLGHAFATVTRRVEALVAVRRVPRGHTIGPADVAVCAVEADRAEGCVREVSAAVGRRAVVALEPGTCVSRSFLEKEDLIKRGDSVELEVGSKGLKVTLKTEALESGTAGELLRLRRAGSRREYIARVLGPGRAAPVDGGGE